MKVLLRRILVTTDLSPASRKAFSYAMGLAEEFAAEVRVLYVMEPSVSPAGGGFGAGATKSAEAERACAWEELETWVEERGPDMVGAKLLVREGKAAEEIITVAREERIDVIVISTHGRGGARQVPLGRTADAVVRQAGCHVMLVRDGGRGEGS